MAIVNNAYKLGNGSSNIVLDTAGKIYVKVADRYYELNFRDSGSSNTTIIQNIENNNTEQVDTSNLVSKDYLKASLTDYFSKRDWAAVQETLDLLQGSLLGGYTEAISPITINTMQAVVGNTQLQYEFIQSLTNDTIVSNIPYITEDDLICKPGFIKHYTLGGPSAVQPNENGSNLKQYCRWKISDLYSSEELAETKIHLVNDDIGYYLYIVINKINWSQSSVDSLDDEVAKTGIYAKTGTGYYLLSDRAKYIEDDSNYYLLYAIINSKQNGSRSIATMNGFTEILPGQITAYIFKTKEGDQYLDFLDKKFHIGHSPTIDNGTYLHWDTDNGLVVKGNISVVGGELRTELDSIIESLSGLDDIEYLKKALKGRTDLSGGLILTNLIQLGFSYGDADNIDDYYSKFILMSGISGQVSKTKTIGDRLTYLTYQDIAAWYGGPMKDLELDNSANTRQDFFIDNKHHKKYTFVEYLENEDRYKWVNSDGDIVYLVNDPPEIGDSIKVSLDGSIAVANFYVWYYSTGFALSLFRMDGTGYLANGNISWETNGHLTLKNISVIEAADIGPFKVNEDSVAVINDTTKKEVFRVNKNECIINGSLKSQSSGYYDNASVEVISSDGEKIADIGSQPLSTLAMPTYIRNTSSSSIVDKKGSIFGGKVTIPNDWYWYLLDEYRSYAQNEIYKINDINIYYDIRRVSKPITMKLLLRDTNLINSTVSDTVLFTKTWNKGNTSSGTLSTNTNSSNKITLSTDSINTQYYHSYTLVMYLEPGGQVQSSAASDSLIKFTRELCEAQVTRSEGDLDIGTFIRPNGISSVFGNNSRFQWIGAMSRTGTIWNQDLRSKGGSFIVELPADTSTEDPNKVGLQITGYYDANGNTTAGAGVWINLGNGWYKLRIDGDTLKVETQ